MKREACANPSCKGSQEHVVVFLDTPVAAFVRMKLRPMAQPNTVTLRVPCHLCRPKARKEWEESGRLVRLPGQPNLLKRNLTRRTKEIVS